MIVLPILIFILALGVDRLTKLWALANLSFESISIFPWFELVLDWNKGVSWNFLWAETPLGYWLLVGMISTIILAFFLFAGWRATQGYSIICEMLVLGGAVSNIIDRLWYGAVLDFIHVYIGSYSWPVFNVADVCIVTGISLIMLKTWKGDYE